MFVLTYMSRFRDFPRGGGSSIARIDLCIASIRADWQLTSNSNESGVYLAEWQERIP